MKKEIFDIRTIQNNDASEDKEDNEWREVKKSNKDFDSDEATLKLFSLFLDEEFLEKNADKIDWQLVTKLDGFPNRFSNEFIRKFAVEFNWDRMAIQSKLDVNFVIEFKNNFSQETWNEEFYNRLNLNEEQLLELSDKIMFFDHYIKNNKLSEKFVLENKDKFQNLLTIITKIKNPSVEFLLGVKDHISWYMMIEDSKIEFTEELLDAFRTELPWSTLLEYVALSDRLLEKYKDDIIGFFGKRFRTAEDMFADETEKKKIDVKKASAFHGIDFPLINPFGMIVDKLAELEGK